MPDQTPIVRHPDLVAGLRRIGVRPGGVAMAHSSLSALGWVEGGAATVIEAFLDALGPTGTLVMPTLCVHARERRFAVWDHDRSPSDVGRTTETLRLDPRSVRSDHATHSVAAIGPLASWITRGHVSASGRPGPWGEAAFGHRSPWERLYDLNARYLFLGVNFRVNTLRHFIQSLLVERTLACLPRSRRAAAVARVRGWEQDGVWPDYSPEPMQAHIDSLGLLDRTRIGNATVLAYDTRDMVDAALAVLEGGGESWLNGLYVIWRRSALEAG